MSCLNLDFLILRQSTARTTTETDCHVFKKPALVTMSDKDIVMCV